MNYSSLPTELALCEASSVARSEPVIEGFVQIGTGKGEPQRRFIETLADGDARLWCVGGNHRWASLTFLTTRDAQLAICEVCSAIEDGRRRIERQGHLNHVG